jgi:hypothetical protein
MVSSLGARAAIGGGLQRAKVLGRRCLAGALRVAADRAGAAASGRTL